MTHGFSPGQMPGSPRECRSVIAAKEGVREAAACRHDFKGPGLYGDGQGADRRQLRSVAIRLVSVSVSVTSMAMVPAIRLIRKK